MIEIIVEEGNKSVELNLPEKISEINDDYIKEITNHIVVAPYHTLVALFYKTSLQDFTNAVKNKNSKLTSSVVPVMVKHGICNDENQDKFTDAIPYKSILLIPESSLMIGYTPSVPQNQLHLNKIAGWLHYDYSGKKTISFKDGAKFTFTDERINKNIVLLDFKIIPNTEIKSYYLDHTIDTKLLNFVNVR